MPGTVLKAGRFFFDFADGFFDFADGFFGFADGFFDFANGFFDFFFFFDLDEALQSKRFGFDAKNALVVRLTPN